MVTWKQAEAISGQVIRSSKVLERGGNSPLSRIPGDHEHRLRHGALSVTTSVDMPTTANGHNHVWTTSVHLGLAAVPGFPQSASIPPVQEGDEWGCPETPQGPTHPFVSPPWLGTRNLLAHKRPWGHCCRGSYKLQRRHAGDACVWVSWARQPHVQTSALTRPMGL